jgi:hypothetical protein
MHRRVSSRPFREGKAAAALGGFLAACLCLASCHKSPKPAASGIPSDGAARGDARTPPSANTTPTAEGPPPGMFDLIHDPDTSVLHTIDPKTLTESQRKFGISPQKSAAVEYQPDVIIMEHGDQAIRSLAKNGMTWEFDATAPQVDQFQQGKIIFATGLAVGRIIDLKRTGSSVTVTLGPIQLTDVIKNGKFAMQESIDVNNVLVYSAPEFPQPKEQTTPFGSSARRFLDQPYGSTDDGRFLPVQQLTPGIINMPAPPPPLPPIPNADALGKLPVVNIDDDVREAPIFNLSEVGAQLYYYKKGGPSVMAEAALSVRKLQIFFELLIKDGSIIKCGVNIDGAVGARMHISAITYGKDFAVNWNRTLWLPVDLKIPLGLNSASPVPFSITFNTLLDIGTRFSAKNASLSADGDYTFGGGLWAGYKKEGGWQVSTAGYVHANKDLGVTTTGLSVGINSLTMAAGVRAMVGIGAFGFNTGVYGGLRFGGSILRAPDIAWACRQGTIQANFDSGVGYSLPPGVSDAINWFLSFFTSYKLDRVGSILTADPRSLFHGITQIPAGCATPKSGTTSTEAVRGRRLGIDL